ncbi:MAG TPA: macro domain-containing protein [Longimicrobiales bacterium]|nr:macro domain-containing protein [Longimicrobiales bacterium]
MIRLLRGDLSEAPAEAIFHPIRSDGAPITSVGRRLETRAGPKVAERVAAQGDFPVGTAFLTPGGDTAADFLIHLVLQSPEEPMGPQVLERALRNGLRRASDFGIDSVALPPLGTGAGQLGVEESAGRVIPILAEHLAGGRPPGTFLVVTESAFDETAVREALEALAPGLMEPAS